VPTRPASTSWRIALVQLGSSRFVAARRSVARVAVAVRPISPTHVVAIGTEPNRAVADGGDDQGPVDGAEGLEFVEERDHHQNIDPRRSAHAQTPVWVRRSA
jgi:hypothetical protein